MKLARELPKEGLKREVERHLTRKETGRWEIIYFKFYSWSIQLSPCSGPLHGFPLRFRSLQLRMGNQKMPDQSLKRFGVGCDS